MNRDCQNKTERGQTLINLNSRASLEDFEIPRPSGFTMVELLTVIAIIAMLAGILLPALNRARQQAWETTARTMISSLEAALANYMTDYGDYPQDDPAKYMGSATVETCSNLITLLETYNYASFRTQDKIQDSSTPPDESLKDPWGSSYCYRYNTGTVKGSASDPDGNYGIKFNIWSKGANASASVTTDDITNWKTTKGQ